MNRANCQALEPEWAALRGRKGDAVVSIDCSADAKLCQDAGVSSIPAIRLHHPDGGQTRYRGPRDAASIKGFLDRTRRPAVSHISDQNTTVFRSSDDVVFIGHFGAGDPSLQGWFEVGADKYHDRYSFAVSTAKQQQKGPVLECYNNFDGIQRSTMDFANPSSIERFVKLCSTPLIPELTRRNELSFYEVLPDRNPTKTSRGTDRFCRRGRASSITL
jgi:protein disulfide-isomerase A1